MTELTPADLAALRAANEARRRLKSAATEGPWETTEAKSDDPWTRKHCLAVYTRKGYLSGDHEKADAAFMVAARTDPVEAHVDTLLAEVECLQVALTRTESDRCIARRAAREAACEVDRLKADLREAKAEADLLRAGNIALSERIEVCSQLLAKRAERKGANQP